MSSHTKNSSERFTDRVGNYARYRPGYPSAVFEALVTETGLSSSSVIADIGSGTGLSAELFLKLGCVVYGVEPNSAMRQAAEETLRSFPMFRSVAGTAEDSTLPAASADYVVAGQAFHWFDPPRARREFARILRPNGWVVLMWNRWNPDATPFLRAYEDLLLRFGTDYRQVDHRNVSADILRSMFAPGTYREHQFAHAQAFELDGATGRLLSSSYVPAPGHPNHEPMVAQMRRVFDAHQDKGQVSFDYQTNLYFGRPASD